MRFLFSVLIIVLLGSCGKKNAPDVSHIKVDLPVERFEQSFFKADTNNLSKEIPALLQQHPDFMPLFLDKIINVDRNWATDTMDAYVRSFITAYRPVYDTTQRVFKNFAPYADEVKQGLRYVHYYFPKYPLPKKLITYVGPLDGYGDIITPDAIIVGLHHHIDSNYSQYNEGWLINTYPRYISQRFTPEMISVNAMKNIVSDMYPQQFEDKTLVVQMVEAGKRLYLLQQFLPDTKESLLIGYTDKQMKECYAHEAQIWDLFLQNNYLQVFDNNIVKNYIGENPKTQELGEGAPGNIGAFAGWQIVKKYMTKNAKLRPEKLMATDAEKIYEEAKYKP